VARETLSAIKYHVRNWVWSMFIPLQGSLASEMTLFLKPVPAPSTHKSNLINLPDLKWTFWWHYEYSIC